MTSEQYHIPSEEYPEITRIPAEVLLPPLATESGREAFYRDENLKYFGGLGVGRYMRAQFRNSQELRNQYAQSTYIEAYNHHAEYLARRENPNTKLPNGVALEESYAKMIRRLKPGQSLVVLRIDMDRFKAVNKLGYERGTQVLSEVGHRMSSIMRANNDILVHLGQEGEVDVSNPHGDEFVALMIVDTNPVDRIPKKGPKKKPATQETDPEKARQKQFARRVEAFTSVKQRSHAIMMRFEEEVQRVLDPVAAEVNQIRTGFNTRDIVLGISIGRAIRGDQEDLATLLSNADNELKKVKEKKRQAEVAVLEPDSRSLAEVGTLAMRAVGINPDRIIEQVLGEGEVPVGRQIEIMEKGIDVLQRNLKALKAQQEQQ